MSKYRPPILAAALLIVAGAAFAAGMLYQEEFRTKHLRLKVEHNAKSRDFSVYTFYTTRRGDEVRSGEYFLYDEKGGLWESRIYIDGSISSWKVFNENRPNQRLQGTPESVPSSSTEPEARRP